MLDNSKILCFVLYLFVVPIKLAALPNTSLIQIDSLIQEKNIRNDMTQLELLVLYNDALHKKHLDSIKIFKKLALLNADLGQPKDAYLFTEKYINNTLDFSILNNGVYNVIRETEEYNKLNDKYLPNISVLAFIYLYAALIGFFFALIINFTKQENKCAKVFIGSFVAVHSLFILDFVIYMSNMQYRFAHTYRMSSTVALLYGPLLYFYFKSITQNFKFRYKDFLHFLPTIILLVLLMPIYTLSFSEKLKIMLGIDINYRHYDSIIFISKITSLIIYALFIGKLLMQKSAINESNENKQPIDSWKKTIYRIHIAYVISYLIYGVFAYGAEGFISSLVYHVQIGAMSIMIIYISYLAYVQPNMLKSQSPYLKGQLFLEKYKKSGLTDALSKELKENLVRLLVEEKIYKESNINLEKLSKKLNTTRHNTSQIINEHFNMNFFELINKFRIEEAAFLLKEDVHGNLNIIDVAYEVGYNNKVTFNKAFKKELSLTPSEFINSLT